MNAVATSAADNGVYGSDSDTNSDDSPEYYQPISADDEDGADFSNPDPNPNIHQLPNGWVENGLSPLDLSDEEEDDEAEAEAEASERAIERAFREDDRRRNAPLTAETAVRVMEAMREVSLGGGAPEWARQVPEEQWLDSIRRLRGQSN